MSKILDGRQLALNLQEKMKMEVQTMTRKPGLVVVIIGENPASQTYVKNKERAAERIGIRSVIERLPEATTEEELLKVIEKYNQDNQIDGILVQLPLPAHINDERVLLSILPSKDVDGFHPMNMGHLFSGKPNHIPCTPYGIIKLLEANGVDIEGKRAVVVGRSNIVGKPMAQLLLMKNATVTLVHSKTEDLVEYTKAADILVVAIGQGHFIKARHVKEGAVVVDVGMNRDANGKLIGDVDFEEVKKVASLITPVPGGVGPMTITMLMEQTIANVRE